MTTTVMGQDDPGVNRAESPIVLALNCPQAQQYLTETNVVLQRLITPYLVRIDIEWESSSVPALYLNRISTGTVGMERFMDANEHRSWKFLKEKAQDLKWLAEEFRAYILHELYREQGEEEPPTMTTERTVKIVLIDASAVNDSETLRLALEPAFPDAWFFCVNKRQHSLPERIWTAPLCRHCGREMRLAGSCFVCEGCGSTAGLDDNSRDLGWDDDMSGGDVTRCMKCGGPTRTIMYGAVGAQHKVCEDCGHAEPIHTI